MSNPLDASIFVGSSYFKISEFQDILTKIVECYKLMISDGIKVENDENKIRDLLHRNYLDNNEIRNNLGLTDYLFHPEVPETNSTGRTDIRITTINTFKDTSDYYLIECKRLDNKNLTGKTGLNSEYIANGIMRFVTGKYSTYSDLNGMIGFVVETMDIQKNIQNINDLLDKKPFDASTEKSLRLESFIKNFKYQYYSSHRDFNNKVFNLYHLMLDFSDNLEIV